MQKLSNQQITKRFHQMGVLLILDCPEGLQFGIDNISWEVGNKFKGIKLIPLGTHIITYSLKNEDHMFPIKKFIYFGSPHKQIRDEERIRVYRWASKAERFVSLTGQQAQGYRQGVKKYHFDCYLGPYPDQNIQFWSTNTKYITKQVLDKLDPIQYYQDYQQQYEGKKKQVDGQEQNANIDSQSEGNNQDINEYLQDLQLQQKEEKTEKTQKNIKKQQNPGQIKKQKDFGGNIYYSQIPRRLTESLSHTTKINMDRTQILQSILQSNWPKNEFGILGQLQYSFISFLIGQCLDSYNQWKKLMIMLSSAQAAFNTRKNLMLEFVVVFYQQVRQFPQNFFQDQLAKDNFLTICLKNFNLYYVQKNINKKALSRIQKLLAFIQQKFHYEPPEQQEQTPIVVVQNQSYF